MTNKNNMIRTLLPGILLCSIIALAVFFFSDGLGGPALLYALLVGMVFNFLADDQRFAAGIHFASHNVLRFGVALLGVRITTGDVIDLGWPVTSMLVAAVVATILFGWLIGHVCGLRGDHSILSAGAVAICGASAALAIASVLPSHKDHERNTVLTVASVTALSTIAMVLYPVFVSYLDFDNTTAGIFIGATIHNVVQVVGAGYIISDEAGEISVLVKLMRVACLVPVVISISLLMRKKRSGSGLKEPLLPWFLVAFVVLVIVNSVGWIPPQAHVFVTPVSSGCLLVAVAALGVKTSLKALADVGPGPIAAMVLQTLFLAVFVLAGIYFVI